MSRSMASFEKLSDEASTKLPDSELASQAEGNDSDMDNHGHTFFKEKQVDSLQEVHRWTGQANSKGHGDSLDQPAGY